MRPAWSVLLLTTLIGAGQGLFLALAATELFSSASPTFFVSGAVLSCALLAGGLAASFFHLGHPERAWRSAAMWRTSWLAREVIVLPAFMAAVFGWGAAHYLRFSREAIFGLDVLGIVLALALFVCTGMIYACLEFLQEWHSALTPINYTALGCASGLTLAAALAASLHPPLARAYALAALLVGVVAYLLRLASLARNARLRPKSTLATAIGVKHPRIAQIAQGAMGGSFNTREFFHGRPREVVRAVRWTFLALVFPVPALLLVFGKASPLALAAAFALQYAGLLAERWYFFAEARHPQNIYYQSVA
jgi:DMSO reductase anchor subunit